jgi:Zinc finger C-x8-C-x5-C-x3-H type (and similar)
MSPLLSYSGRGRGRGGRGGGGRHYGGRYSYTAATGRGQQSQLRGSNGSNQWVRSKDQTERGTTGVATLSNEATKVESSASVTSAKNLSTAEGGHGSKEPQSLAPASTRAHTVMTKIGRNQLILSNQPNKDSQEKDNASSTTNSTKTLSKPTVMLREGKNKLVAASSSKTASMANAPRKRPPPVPLPNSKPRKRPRHHGTRNSHLKYSTAKRIKVTVSHDAESDGNCSDEHASEDCDEDKHPVEGDMRKSADNNGKESTSDSKTTKEKLTDFAYRETSRVRQRPKVSRNLHWSKSQSTEQDVSIDKSRPQPSGRRNMGLVRVAPDVKKAPICPTYLRGLQCQDEFCRKRHDVPRDFATPVCSFFLRHGNCLRGEECVFRHVKVNPSAMVCPSFSLLGFCEDEACQMQHVRQRIGATKSVGQK